MSPRGRHERTETGEDDMSWSIRIGSLAGTAIRIHVTFVLLLAWIAAAGYASGKGAQTGAVMLFVVLIFACVLLHEFGHIFTARAFGVKTPDVTLLPIGGVARLERIPEKPMEEFLIALAGPMVNVVIALVLMLAGANLNPALLGNVEGASVPLIDRLAMVNLFLAVFNLIPAFPMDGGRVLRALLASQLGFVRATTLAASIGQGIAFLLGFIGLLYNPLLIFIAIFIYLAAAAESHMVSLRAVGQGLPLSAAAMTQIETLEPDTPLARAVEAMLHTSQSEFPIIDGAGKPIGLLGRADIVRAVQEKDRATPVGDVMSAPVTTIDRRKNVDEALRLLQDQSLPAIAVIEPDGRLCGLFSRESVGNLMQIAQALPQGWRWQGRPRSVQSGQPTEPPGA